MGGGGLLSILYTVGTGRGLSLALNITPHLFGDNSIGICGTSGTTYCAL